MFQWTALNRKFTDNRLKVSVAILKVFCRGLYRKLLVSLCKHSRHIGIGSLVCVSIGANLELTHLLKEWTMSFHCTMSLEQMHWHTCRCSLLLKNHSHGMSSDAYVETDTMYAWEVLKLCKQFLLLCCHCIDRNCNCSFNVYTSTVYGISTA